MIKNRIHNKIACLFALTFIVLAAIFIFQKTKAGTNPLDPDRPILLTLWHYRSGTAKAAMDEMISEFNDTVGEQQGIVVEAYSNGNISKLAKEVYASAAKELGSKPMPDLFTAYNEQAYPVDKLYGLVDLERYFTKEELDQYNSFFLESGRMGEERSLKNLPVAKSAECIYLNKTDWNSFARETGAKLSDLATFEGISATAGRYYKWSGGKAFWGAQDIINFMKATAAMEREKAGTKDIEVLMSSYYSEETVKKIWNYFYIPYIRGYYSDEIEKSQSMNAIKQGELLMAIASTAGAVYFPGEVLRDSYTQYKISSKVLPYPYYENEKKYVTMRGNSICITKSDYAHEYASALFLKWFTSPEQNVKYTVPTGYLPVETEALKTEEMGELSQRLQENPIIQRTNQVSLQMMEDYFWYDGLLTENNYKYDSIFKEAISKKAKKDKAEIRKRAAKGEDRETLLVSYSSDIQRESWYHDFLKETAK